MMTTLTKKTIDYYSDISFTDKLTLFMKQKIFFSSISNEKTTIDCRYHFWISVLKEFFDPRYEITSDELTLFNEDIFSLDNILLLIKYFGSLNFPEYTRPMK